MGTIEKSWDGIDLVIFGRDPGVPMDLEVTITENIPGIEVKLESFEDYEQALDYCKARVNVGFIISIEDQKQPGTYETFRNLAAPFASQGWGAYGALVHRGNETLDGYRSLRKDPRLVDYVNWASFVQTETCIQTMQDIWSKFVKRFEADLIPQALQESVFSVALKKDRSGFLPFHQQLVHVISYNMAISWRDSFALEWYPALDFANQQEPALLEPHVALQNVVRSIHQDDIAPFDIQRITNTSLPLASRLLELCYHLNEQRQNDSLEKFFNSIASFSKPGSPAILRSLIAQKQAVLQLARNIRVA